MCDVDNMSSSHIFPIVTATVDPDNLNLDTSTNAMGTVWYAPVAAANNNTYMTPLPSSTFDTYPISTAENTPWMNQYQSTGSDLFTDHSFHFPQATFPPPTMERSHSSPSFFGPTAESINWPENPLGIHYSAPDASANLSTAHIGHPFPEGFATGTMSSPAFSSRRASETQRFYPALLPNPAGLAALDQDRKRKAEEEEERATKRPRRRTPSNAADTLNDDDRFLIALKENECLPWKDIAARFSDRGKICQVAALQMRYKRLRERFRVWETRDVEALKMAHEYWEKCKWDIISATMLDYGITERWPKAQCSRKWADLSPRQLPTTQALQASRSSPTPGPSQYSTPQAGPSQYAYMSM